MHYGQYGRNKRSSNVLSKIWKFDVKMNDVPLQTVTVYKYLGVTLDNQLMYNQHVKRIISNITAKLKQFQRMRSFLNEKAALMVYKNMLLPMLEYGDIFLSATSVVNRKCLQIPQNKGLRCVHNVSIDVGTTELHTGANLLKLKYRKEQHLLNYMYDQCYDKNGMHCRTCFIMLKTNTCTNRLSII